MNKSKTTFEVLNDTANTISILHEPECFEFQLPINELAIIEVDSRESSIQLRISHDDGKVTISILDDSSLYKVFHNKEDVFKKYM